MATYVVMKENTSDHSSDYTLYAGTKAGKATEKVLRESKDTTYIEVWVRGEHLYTVTPHSEVSQLWVYKFSDESTKKVDWWNTNVEKLLTELGRGRL